MRAGLPRHLVVIWRSEKKFSIRGLGSAPIFATEPDKGDEKSRLGYLNVFICWAPPVVISPHLHSFQCKYFDGAAN
jgi:hypothetical protein